MAKWLSVHLKTKWFWVRVQIRNELENVNQEVKVEIEAVQTEPLKKTGQKKKTEVKSKDIHDMFQNPHQNPRQNPHHDSRRETQNVIVIDLL